MQRSYVFEAALVLILIGLAGLLCYIVLSESPAGKGDWEMPANGSVDYMYVGSNDTLYTFSGNHITAIGKDGGLRWDYEFAPGWKVLNDWPMVDYTFPMTVAGNPEGPLSRYSNTHTSRYENYPIVAESDGSLYVYAFKMLTDDEWNKLSQNISDKFIGSYWYYGSETEIISHPCAIVSIAPDGKVAWTYDIMSDISSYSEVPGDPVAIHVYGDRVFVFHDNRQDVLGRDGRLLFSIGNISRPASVDESGRIYTVRAEKPAVNLTNVTFDWDLLPDDGVTIGLDVRRMVLDPTYLVPTSIVDAYDQDGQRLWSQDIGHTAVREFVSEEEWAKYGAMPLYVNNTLYVPFKNGIAALDTDGRLKWSHEVTGGTFVYFEKMPADSRGNIYLKRLDPAHDPVYLVTVGPDGREYHDAWAYQQTNYGLYGFYVNSSYAYLEDLSQDQYLDSLYMYYLSMYSGPRPLAGNDGAVYAYTSYNAMDEQTFGRIMATKQFKEGTVTAYDVKTGASLWDFAVPDEDRHRLTINASNYHEALRETPVLSVSAPYAYTGAREQKAIKAYPGNNAVYLSYYYAIYEEPVFGNDSPCLYVNAIYALDNNGKLIWKMPMSGYVTDMATGNSTIYYQMDNGRIGGSKVNVAAGIAFAAMAYLFLRFFMVGTVARARGRLHKNENRNAVLRYVADNPGATATDMAKDLDANMGTIRYHLFILAMNHKVVTYKADNKYLRYFTNAGTYSKEEQSLLSLMRREPLRRTLHAIAEKTGALRVRAGREAERVHDGRPPGHHPAGPPGPHRAGAGQRPGVWIYHQGRAPGARRQGHGAAPAARLKNCERKVIYPVPGLLLIKVAL